MYDSSLSEKLTLRTQSNYLYLTDNNFCRQTNLKFHTGYNQPEIYHDFP